MSLGVRGTRARSRLRGSFVHGNMQDGAKTGASKSSVMMHPFLEEVMKT
jgi:hypothetical protein